MFSEMKAVGLRKSVFGSGRLKSPSESVPSIHSNIKNTCPDSANYLNKSSGIDKQKNPNIRPNHSSFLMEKNPKDIPKSNHLFDAQSIFGEWWIFLHFHRWIEKIKNGSWNLGKYQVPSPALHENPKRVKAPKRRKMATRSPANSLTSWMSMEVSN